MEIRTCKTLRRATVYVAVSGLCEVWRQVDIIDSMQLTREEWHSRASAHRTGTRTSPNEPPPFPSPQLLHGAYLMRYGTRTQSLWTALNQGPVMWVKFAPANLSVSPAEETRTGPRITTPSAVPGSDQLTSDTAGSGTLFFQPAAGKLTSGS